MARGIIFHQIPGNSLGNPETLEEWQKALLLPDTYKVIGRQYVPFSSCGQQLLLVESDDIPEPSRQTGLTLVKPIYRQDINEDGMTYTPAFERMEFEG